MRSANSHFARALIMGACLTAAVSAHAAGGYDAYVGGALGPSSIDADCRLSTSCDDSDMGYKFYAGFELPRFSGPPRAIGDRRARLIGLPPDRPGTRASPAPTRARRAARRRPAAAAGPAPPTARTP